MLQFIRNNVQSFGVKLIVGVIAVVMLGFGISFYGARDVSTLVTIDGYEIKLESYQRALDQAERAIKERYQDQAAEYMKMVNLKKQILNQLSSNVLLIKSAEENGLGVSDEELAQEIYQDQSFVTDGRFDKKKYESLLKNNQIDKLNYEKAFRETLTTRKLIRFLSSDQLISRKNLVAEYKRFNSEMEIQAIEFTSEFFSDSLKLSDKEIEAYYNSHKNDFMLNPRIVVNYFTVGTDDIKNKTLVRDKETRQYYQKNKKKFTRKASFLLKQILIAAPQDNSRSIKKAKKKAEKIHQQLLKNPKKFASLSRKYSFDSLSAKKGGDMGWLEKDEFPLPGKFKESVEKLKKGEISEPFLTPQGYHIVKLSDKKDSRIVPLEEVKSEIENKIITKKARRKLKNKVAKLSEDIKSQSLSALADSLNKKIVKSSPFDEKGNVGPYIKSPRLYYFLKVKKAKDKGHFTLPDEDMVIVYEIENISEPSAKPLEEIKDEIKLLAEREKLQKMTKEKIQKYSSEIKTPDQFDKLSSQLKIKPLKIKFKLSDLDVQPINVGRVFRMEVFKMRPKQFKVISEEDRHFLVYLVGKHERAIQDEDAEKLEILKNQLKHQKTQTLLYALINEMQKKVDIQYNNSILENLDIK